MDGSWKKDVILKSTGCDFEELRGTIGISNKHLIVGFSPTCSDILDKSGILIYTKQDELWKVTVKIESDSCKDYDLKPLAITDNFAFLVYDGNNDSSNVSVFLYNDSRWKYNCDLGPFRYIGLLDANERYLAIGSFEGDSVKIEPKIFIYELFDDSINENPIIIKDFNEELSDLTLFNDRLLVSEMAVPYFFDKWGSISNVTLYQIKENGYSKITQFLPNSKDISRLVHTTGWNSEGFGFSVGLNSEYVFIGSPKDDNFLNNQGSISVIKY
jgi:hypothetical protein